MTSSLYIFRAVAAIRRKRSGPFIVEARADSIAAGSPFGAALVKSHVPTTCTRIEKCREALAGREDRETEGRSYSTVRALPAGRILSGNRLSCAVSSATGRRDSHQFSIQ